MAIPTDGGGWFPGDLRASFFNSIGLYQALLTQSSTDAPVATVLANNLGVDVVWSYVTPGTYLATATGAFTSAKTGVLVTPNGAGTTPSITVTWEDANSISLYTNDGSALADDLMAGTYIEIKVFP